ncbi:MAG: hypothetical protein IPQ07_16575 [Myxococcales bacterium]|nr:hypothetical protein [Myxococcales bacterium]
MLDGLFVTPAVTAITEALASAGAEGKLVVVGNAKLAAALKTKHDVTAVGLTPRAAKKLGDTLADTTTLAAGSVTAVICVDVTEDDAWQLALREWSRIVRDGGAIVLVDRGQADEASRRALCAGLTEIEQRHAGRAVVTSGLVSHLELG